MQTVLPLLKRMPVLVMNKGHWPNSSDVRCAMEAYPGHIVRTEHMYTPKGVRFGLTVQRRK